MNSTKKYSPEVRERAVRLVFEQQGEYPSRWAAICSIANKIGCTPETLRAWCKRAEGAQAGPAGHRRCRAQQFGAHQYQMMQILSSPQIAQGFARVVFDMLMQSSKAPNNQ